MSEIVYNQVFSDMTDFFVTLTNDVMTEHNLPKDKIKEINFMSDLGRRVTIITEEKEYVIRLWNVRDDEDHVYVDYDVYEDHGDDITVLGV